LTAVPKELFDASSNRKDCRILNRLLLVGLVSAAWCALHSVFVTHKWGSYVRRRWPRHHALSRLVYVGFSTVSFAALAWWLHSLDARLLWDWPGWWSTLRWIGLIDSALLFWLGASAFDGRAFLGIRQWRDHRAGRPQREPPFRTDGILGMIRHPWYTGTLLLLLFCLPATDVNLVWRSVMFVYVLIGTELEERKLLREIGLPYEEYRRRVPRFFPRIVRSGK